MLHFGNRHETGSQKSEHDKRSSNLNKSNEIVCDRPRSSSFEKLGNFMTNSTEKCSDKLPTSYIVIDIDILNKNLFQSVAVSYTHLDVYKRQQPFLSGEMRRVNERLTSTEYGD